MYKYLPVFCTSSLYIVTVEQSVSNNYLAVHVTLSYKIKHLHLLRLESFILVQL